MCYALLLKFTGEKFHTGGTFTVVFNVHMPIAHTLVDSPGSWLAVLAIQRMLMDFTLCIDQKLNSTDITIRLKNSGVFLKSQ